MELKSFPLIPNVAGDQVAELQVSLRTLGFELPQREIEQGRFGAGTRDAVLRFQSRNSLPPTGTVDASTAEMLASWVAAAGTGNRPRVEGRLFRQDGSVAQEAKISFYAIGTSGEERLGEAVADDRGFYDFDEFPEGFLDSGQGLQVRMQVGDDPEEVPLSDVRREISGHELLNLVVPKNAVVASPEYSRLSEDLRDALGDIRLADLREAGDQREITTLRQKTGWDARLISFAVEAERRSDEVGVAPEVLYTLFRVGLPTDLDQLATLSSDVLRQALEKGQESEISATAPEEAVLASLRDFSNERRTRATAGDSWSSVGQMVDSLNLPQNQRRAVLDAYFDHDDSDAFWKALEGKVETGQIRRMEAQGKLGYLTHGNAALTAKLLNDGIDHPGRMRDLVEKGFYDQRAWETALRDLVDGNEELVGAVIPDQFVGDTPGARLDGYTRDMARRVRQSFPTAVVAHKLGNDVLRLGVGDETLRNDVKKVLTRASDLGLELGRGEIASFLTNDEDPVLKQILSSEGGIERLEAARDQARRVDRLYQITPSDEVLGRALELELGSALDVVRFSRDQFENLFDQETRDLAAMMYRKAREVHGVSYGIFSGIQSFLATPRLFGTGANDAAFRRMRAKLKSQFPNLTSLFGSLDYCECEHCESIFSPAAYLVDLLHFLDPHESVWAQQKQDWLARHGGVAYPFTSTSDRKAFESRWKARNPDTPVPPSGRKPFDVLADRRPDLAHIPLTCENTHTALPYVDVATEIMEHFVVHDALGPEAAHDTGDARTPDLLAEPANLLPAAYGPLKTARYPVSLPFDVWLETSRALVRHFGVKFADALEAFRTHDQLDGPPPSYGHGDVFTETLGWSPAEIDLLTAPDPIKDWNELFGYDTATAASKALTSAATLADRLGVTYVELDALVRTRFVNPVLEKSTVLRKLGLDVREFYRFKRHPEYADRPLSTDDRKEIEARLNSLDGQDKNALDELWAATPQGQHALDGVVILLPPEEGCSFLDTDVLRADHKPVTPYDLVRLHLFVRLWRRLSASTGRLEIDELDTLLAALLPGLETGPLPPNQLGSALRTALIYLAHLETLRGRLRIADRAREHLVTLWTDLPTFGPDSLYAHLFLRGADAAQRTVFDPLQLDQPAGNVSGTSETTLADHMERVQGALGLSVDEVEAVLGPEAGSKPLDLANLSELHRHAVLARGLRMSVVDLKRLADLSGLEPFHRLQGSALASLDDDHPFHQTLRFVDLAQRLSAAGFDVAELDYWVRHPVGSAGEYGTDPAVDQAFLAELAQELRRIRLDLTMLEQPPRIEDEALWQRIGLVLPAESLATLRGMCDGSIEYRAAVSRGAPPATALDPSVFAAEPRVEVGVDPVRNEQWLLYRGVLTEAEKTRLAGFKEVDSSPAVVEMLTTIAQKARSFFNDRLRREDPADGSTVGFLGEATFAELFEGTASSATKAQRLLDAFTPYVEQALSRQAIVRAVASRTGQDESTTRKLLAQDDRLDALRALQERGVTVAYMDANGVEIERSTSAYIDAEAPPSGAIAVRYTGYLEVPTTDVYRFHVHAANAGSRIRLRFGGAPPLIETQATQQGEVFSQHVTLEAGVLHRFELIASQLGGGRVRMQAQSRSLGLGELDRWTLLPSDALGGAQDVVTLLSKLASLADRLELGGDELLHVLAHGDDFAPKRASVLAGKGLANVPVRFESTASTDVAAALVELLEGLAVYVELRDEMAGGTPGLLAIMAAARRRRPRIGASLEGEKAALLRTLVEQLAALTRRDAKTVSTVAEHLGLGASGRLVQDVIEVEASAFARPRDLKRLWTALQIVQQVGIAPATLLQALTPRPNADAATVLRGAVRARFDDEAWHQVAPGIFDPLRQRRRDALVAYLLHAMRLQKVEELYEHFLIDPAMEPVVQTSRIQLAIASVQLFVQRCLLNLEPQVDPSAIDAGQWTWMKRYRVWEAARKLAMFPENWLEPEFRDDKTHLFQELEGSLLQNDVSEDAAEQAIFRYMRGLEEIAHLDIVSLHEERRSGGTAAFHVLGRTARLPHRYYYRRYRHHMWSPWQPVDVEIEGDHVVVAVWRRRVQVFWVTFLDKGVVGGEASGLTKKAVNATVEEIEASTEARAARKRVEVQLNWAELVDGEWSPRESSSPDDGEQFSAVVARAFDPRDIFIHVETELEEGRDRALQIHLGPPLGRAFRVVSRNAVPRVIKSKAAVLPPFIGVTPTASKLLGPESGELGVSYLEKVELTTIKDEAEDGEDDKKKDIEPKPTPKRILGGSPGGRFNVVPCNNGHDFLEGKEGSDELDWFVLALYGHPVSAKKSAVARRLVAEWSVKFATVLSRPFFYQNDEHVFFVDPSVETEKILKWKTWYPPRKPVREVERPDWWRHLPVEARFPRPDDTWPVPPRDPGWIDPVPHEARFKIRPEKDWLANPGALVRVRDTLLGPAGGLDIERVEDLGRMLSLDDHAAGLARIRGVGRDELVRATLGSSDVSPVVIGGGGLSRDALDRIGRFGDPFRDRFVDRFREGALDRFRDGFGGGAGLFTRRDR